MQLKIEIINVQSTTKPTAKGSYVMLDVAFKRLDTGKIEGKKIMSFTNKEVYDTLAKATNGQQFTVTTEKNDKTGYWDWTGISGGGGEAAAPASRPAAAGFASPKSNYETPEERAARQILIVRQSSLSNAIDLLKSEKKPPTVEEVLRTADIFSNWVFQKDVKLDGPIDISMIDDDIPM